jgi:hypothetical protein
MSLINLDKFKDLDRGAKWDAVEAYLRYLSEKVGLPKQEKPKKRGKHSK